MASWSTVLVLMAVIFWGANDVSWYCTYLTQADLLSRRSFSATQSVQIKVAYIQQYLEFAPIFPKRLFCSESRIRVY